MNSSGKTVSVIVLSYLLFGLFSLFQFGEFVVPVTYNALVVFAITCAVFIPHRKQLKTTHALFFMYASLGFILHPFFWEIFLNQEQQFILFDNTAFDFLKLIQWVILTAFFVMISYNKEENKLKIEWLLPALVSAGCLLNPPMWYVSLLFILSGLSAFYTLKRRTIGSDVLMDVLVGIGIIYLISIFYYC